MVAPLFRSVDVLLFLVMMMIVGFTYKLKDDEHARVREVKKLSQKIATQENSLQQLRAQWALLTQPERIEKLVKRYNNVLHLETMEPSQIVNVEDLPNAFTIKKAEGGLPLKKSSSQETRPR